MATKSLAKKSETVQALALVEIDHEPWADSKGIAEELGVSHESVMRLVDENRTAFESLGPLRLEVAVVRVQGGGTPARYAMLNESQCNFLLTLVRNTKKSKPKKLKLVQLFRVYKELAKKATAKETKQAIHRASLECQQARIEGKVVRRTLTDSIHGLVAETHAKGLSSSPEQKFQMSYTMMINRLLGIKALAKGRTREELDAINLQRLQQAELLAAMTIEEDRGAGLPYKSIYKDVEGRVQMLVPLLPKPREQQALTG